MEVEINTICMAIEIKKGESASRRAARASGTFLGVVLTSVATAAFVSFVFLAFSETPMNMDVAQQTLAPAPAYDGDSTVLSHEEAVIAVVEKASQAVVSVVATRDLPVIEQFYVDPFGGDFFGGQSPFRIPQFRQNGTEEQEVSVGTGFVVTEDGLVLTNRHVVDIDDADFTVIFPDGTRVPAEVMALDPIEDLAVLKIEREGIVPLPLGDSSTLRAGQSVVAIGNALGEFQNTVSVGVISGLDRRIVAGDVTAQSVIVGAIQTDAAINRGNSGGPLLNLSGEVIGINTAIIIGSENIGFAIPIAKAARALADVQEFGHISRPWLGVRFVNVTEEIAEARDLPEAYGAIILGSSDGRQPGVFLGSPAADAGIREGDVILEVDGVRVTASNPLDVVIAGYSVGDTLTLRMYSDRAERSLSVTLGDRSE